MAVNIRNEGIPRSHAAALGRISSETSFHKFGRNPNLRADEDIWDASSAYPINTENLSLEIVSDDANDNYLGTGARVVQVFGVDENWIEQCECVELNGTTAVSLNREYMQIHRAKVTQSGSGLVNAGNIVIRIESAGATQAQISAGMGQTLMTVWAQPANEKLLITDVHVSGINNTTFRAKFAIQVYTEGTSWQTKETFGYASTSGLSEVHLNAPIVVEPKSIVRVRCLETSANDVDVSVTLGGHRYFDDDKVTRPTRSTILPINVPTGVSATPGDGEIDLAWTDTNVGESGYEIWRKVTSGGTYELLTTTTAEAESYTDSSLTNGTAYYYKIKAVRNTIAESEFSSEVNATPAEAVTGSTMIVGQIDILGTIGSLNGQYQLSTDGAADTWTTDNVTGATGEAFYIKSITAGNGLFCAALVDGTSTITSVYTSSDGSTWTDQTSAKPYRHWWVGDRWYCCDGTNLFSTTDFSSYTTLALCTGSAEVEMVGTSSILAIDDNGTLKYSTDQGATLSSATTQPAGGQVVMNMFHDGTYFWRMDDDSKVYRSADADTWSDTSAGFTQGVGTTFNHFGYDGTYIYVATSSDGSGSEIKHTDPDTISWVADTPPEAARFYDVQSDGNQVVFFGIDASYGNSEIWTYSGGTFTSQATPTNTVIAGAMLPQS